MLDLKFSNRQVWANSVDSDKDAPRGGVRSGSSPSVIQFSSF